jgi:SAM-dependent methyltransferase
MNPPRPPDDDEAAAVRERYARRAQDAALDWRYHRLNPAALWPAQERERALAQGLLRHCAGDVDRLRQLRLLEVGSGAGGNLLDLLRFGFAPKNLAGVELLPERHAQARAVLPPEVALWQGDALQLDLPSAGFDLVLQSTVFSSLLDDAFQQRLADAMWRCLRPGGAVVWYDFTVGNPRNPDVRGVPLKRVRALFPQAAALRAQRLTLAPPIARAAAKVHPRLYDCFNAVPWLRTHLLCWVRKP